MLGAGAGPPHHGLVVLPHLDVRALAAARPAAWASLAYLSLVSMLLGFFAWYRGLALGGVARVAFAPDVL